MQIVYQPISEIQSQTATHQFNNLLARFVLVIWGVTVIVGGAFLMAGHWLALPIPAGNDPKLTQAIDHARDYSERGQWLSVHILYAKCSCSQQIVDHLFSNSRSSKIKEKLIIVDDDRPEWLALAKSHGFSYKLISPKELHDIYNIVDAPLMVVADPLS